MKRDTIAAILMIIFIAFGASASNAQFGDLMKKAQDKIDKSKKKVDEKTNQTTTQTTGGNNTGATNFGDDEGARWDLFKCNPKYVGAVDENRLREIVKYNVNGYMGKGGLIVFTKQPLSKETPTLADSVTTFKGGDPIYMTLVFPEAKELDDSVNLSTGGDVITTVGEYQKECQGGMFKNNLYVNYGLFEKRLPKLLKLDFQPADGKSEKYQQQIKFIAESLRKLKPGVHLVPIRISANDGETAAVGAFYYDNRDGSGNNLAIEAGLKQITMPASSGKFAPIEKQILALGKPLYVRVVVTDNDWTPLRHEISGVLIGRAITAVTAMKLEDGSCRRETQSWIQDYNGSTYTNLRLDGFREQLDMACENALK